MKEIMTVFAFTLRDHIRKKAFIVTTALVLVLIIAACSIPAILSRGDDGGEPTDPDGSGNVKQKYTCYLLDESNLVPNALETLGTAYPEIKFEKADPSKAEQYKIKPAPIKAPPEKPPPGER